MNRVIWTAEAIRAIEEAMAQADPELKEVIDLSLIRLRALLEYDAPNFGESRDGTVRIGFSGSCGIYFTVDNADDGIVRVIHFWTLKPRA